MFELKKCPFCGGEAALHGTEYSFVRCTKCGTETKGGKPLTRSINQWNRRVGDPPTKNGQIETNIFDIEEIHHNCTVQILRNSVTGERSIGWWPEEQPPRGFNDGQA